MPLPHLLLALCRRRIFVLGHTHHACVSLVHCPAEEAGHASWVAAKESLIWRLAAVVHHGPRNGKVVFFKGYAWDVSVAERITEIDCPEVQDNDTEPFSLARYHANQAQAGVLEEVKLVHKLVPGGHRAWREKLLGE